MKRRVAWSGGFDSTARVLELLESGERVEAHYLAMDRTWSKQENERDARDRIAAALPAEMRNRLDVVDAPDSWDPQARELFYRLYEEHSDEKEAAEWQGAEDFGPGISAQIPALAAWIQTLGVDGIELAYVAEDMDDYKRFALRWLAQRANIELPSIERSKDDFLGRGFDELLALTWTCDSLGDRSEPCGNCEACQKRIVP